MKEWTPTVYFVGCEAHGLVKIGFSLRPWMRYRQIVMGSPAPVTLLAIAPGRPQDERAIHGRFIRHHRHGEWFTATPEIMEAIARIRTSGVLPEEFRNRKDEPIYIKTDHSYRQSSEWLANRNRWSEVALAAAMVSA